ncbi:MULTISPECIES: TonB-dependent receptor [unclassified Neptuniibacter]|uniref:TonB-dependent receptor n=1 Tax=unclassified Neptuniibacter TaxID=2630693 RepID=UPI000C583C6E|nr:MULTISPECIES: TonB-dependent receptor [unclassified Neptuniibacter]MAY43067.1 TonB-dependent receptor [Oceanospirillaceae bacterium]|tara:strand:+ start:24713 stop:26851 length:2139 start_codon:yes stop_codon:yes gene_type:complete
MQPSLKSFPIKKLAILVSAVITPISVFAEEIAVPDTITVTATRAERNSAEVPESIAIIDQKRIEQEKMYNIADALKGTPGVLIESTSGGYSSRMIVRGAGLKAQYGIREIMVLRDGVPITDPDSFTRMDFIDTQDIEQIEVSKGPGNIYATGSTGGAIHIISKSVFDDRRDQIRLGAGEEGHKNVHLRKSLMSDEGHAFAFTASHRKADNDWRRHNEFESNQFSLKGGFLLSDNSELETEFSYTKAKLNLPGDMNESQFEEYKRTGKQTDNDSAFKHSARDSEIFFFNSRLNVELGALTLKPRLYYNHWTHFHPVTGAINDTPGVDIWGTDLELEYAHELLGKDTLVSGLTYRQDRNMNAKKYAYADIATAGPVITSTLSDRKGDLLEEQDEINTVYGVFLQENLRPNDKLLIDAGFRYDHITIEQDTWSSDTSYNYGMGGYLTVPGSGGNSELKHSFDLFSPRIGVSYKLNQNFTLFGNIAQGEQVPFASELESNDDLKNATSRSIGIGIKGRSHTWQFDLNAYVSEVEDEIINVRTDGESIYQNAGSTDKKGIEFSGSFQVLKEQIAGQLALGFNYAYSDYSYNEFSEIVYGMGPPTNFDRSGNQLPFIPEHYYSINADYTHPSGVKARIQADSWGEYYLDHANSEKYGGYDFVTSVNLSYAKGPHDISLNVQNLFDKRYAVEVTKDTSGDKAFSAGAPRSAMLSYRYQF